MLIATDGACKRNGEPTCFSTGVAWIQTEDGNFLYKAMCEAQSTSQRGELHGLLSGLQYACENKAPDEDVIIVTDSEYLFNSVTLGWSFKWENQDWCGATGPVKNRDIWQQINKYLHLMEDHVFMQWTKGHIISYTPGNTKKAMIADPTGVELYARVVSVATRPYDKGRIISDFKQYRINHGHIAPPDEEALVWAIANTMADCLASYLVKTFDDVLV